MLYYSAITLLSKLKVDEAILILQTDKRSCLGYETRKMHTYPWAAVLKGGLIPLSEVRNDYNFIYI